MLELFGLPGTGKSTVRGQLVSQGIDVRMLTMPPVEGPRLVRSLRFRWARRYGDGRRSWAGLLHARSDQDALGGDLVIEEGVVYLVWRALFLDRSLRSAPWRELLTDRAPLVVLEAPAEVRRSRMAMKETPGAANRRLLRAPVDGPVWDDAESLFQEVLTAAACTRPVVTLDATAPPDRLAAKVLDVLGPERSDANDPLG